MKRSVLLALAGIMLLGAVSGAVIVAASRAPARSSAAGAVEAAPPAAVTAPPEPVLNVPALPGPAAGSVLGRPPPPQPPAEQPRAAPPLAAADDSWDSVPPAGGPRALGAIGPAFVGGLRRSASAKLSACFDADAQARHASSGAQPRVVGGSAASESRGPPVLMLELETLEGAVRIVDAPVETRGYADDGLLLCAQAALRDLRVEVPAARPGGRRRLRYQLVR